MLFNQKQLYEHLVKYFYFYAKTYGLKIINCAYVRVACKNNNNLSKFFNILNFIFIMNV